MITKHNLDDIRASKYENSPETDGEKEEGEKDD